MRLKTSKMFFFYYIYKVLKKREKKHICITLTSMVIQIYKQAKYLEQYKKE